MLENELSKIWKSSPQEEVVKFDKSRFMLDVQTSLDSLQREVKLMYIREGLAVLVVIPVFTYYAFIFPHILSKIGFLLVVFFAGFIGYIMKKRKDKVPDQFSMNYLEYLQKTKIYLEDQKRLQERVLIWYVLPIVGSCWLAGVGMYLENPKILNGLLLTVVVSIVVSIGIHFLNVRSARKVIGPRLDKVNNLIKALQE